MKLKIRLIWRKAMTDFNGVVAEYVHGGYNAICLLGHTDAIKVQRALLALMLSIWRDTGGPE